MTTKLAALGFVIACGGCILFVDPGGPFGTTCGFAGNTSAACGKCIATSCQPSVNACCSEASCAGHLSDLDTCGTTGACGALFTNAQSTAGTALTACVTNQCSSACSSAGAPGDGGADGGVVSNQRVNCPPSSDNYSCTCAVNSLTIGGTCPSASIASLSDVLCCASNGWPSSGSCACYVYSCQTYGDGSGCDCVTGQGNSDYAPARTCEDPTTGGGDGTSGCCLSDDKSDCYCQRVPSGQSLCEAKYSQVPDCDLANRSCEQGNVTSKCE